MKSLTHIVCDYSKIVLHVESVVLFRAFSQLLRLKIVLFQWTNDILHSMLIHILFLITQ